MTRSTGTEPPVPGQATAITEPEASPVHPLADPAFLAGLRPIPTGPLVPSEQRPAVDLEGEDPTGDPVEIRIATRAGPVLLCFLQTRCDGCEEFWRGLGAPPGSGWPDGLSLVAVTHGPDTVDRSEVARLSAGTGTVPVVMSDRAWDDYRITGYPFFVLVDPGPSLVVGETVGFGWSDVRAMVEAAVVAGEDKPGTGKPAPAGQTPSSDAVSSPRPAP